MSEFNVVSSYAPLSVVSPVIPLNFVYPGLSRSQLFYLLTARWKLSAAIIIVALSLTAATLVLWPRTYTATATLMVNYEVNDPLNGKGLPVGQLGSYIATQIELMQTPEVLLTVVDRLKLTDNRDYARGYSTRSGTLRDWVATKLAKTLAIYQGPFGSQLIHVAFSANDPRLAASVANELISVYKEQDLERSTGPPGERAKLYSQQIDAMKANVDRAQRDVTQFHQRHGLVDEGPKANVGVMLLGTLEGRLVEAQNARRVAEARTSQDQSVSDLVLASPEIQALKTQLANQDARLAELAALFKPGWPAIENLQVQRDATQRSLAHALQTYAGNATASAGMARRLEKDLQRAVAEQRGNVLAEGQLHDEAAAYLLALESAQSVYKRGLDDYDLLKFASGGHYTNVVVVSKALPPVNPSKPKLLFGAALGCMAALLAGLGIPLLLELSRRRVRCRDDLERHHGVPVLVEMRRVSMSTAIS